MAAKQKHKDDPSPTQQDSISVPYFTEETSQ